MTNLPVARTKIVVPSRHADVLNRQRLLELFYELLDNRLIIVAAPAGYGKSTLLVDFAHQADLPTCWFDLDELDQEPRRFLAGFIAALSHRFSDFGKEATAALQSMTGEIDWDRLVAIMVNDAYRHIGEHFLLVIDDYHFVDDSDDIVNFINQFVQRADENSHVVLSTRKLPALPDLPLMVARSQVGGIGFQALAFQRQELQTLLLQNYSLTLHDAEANMLLEQTEGWITGLLLSAQTMGFGMSDRAHTAQVSGVGLYDYLAHQVLERQSTAMRQFLLHSSLLDEFNAQFCATVLEPAHYLRTRSWQSFIDEAIRHNLFIQGVGEKGGWVRYHQLFREFLQNQMASRFPDATVRIRRQLASVYTQREEWERAHRLYTELGDLERVASLIEAAGLPMSYAGRQQTLASWIDALPPAVVNASPELLSLRGTVAGDLGELERGMELLDSAYELAVETGEKDSLMRTLVRRASVHRFLGDHERSLRDAEAALELAGESQDTAETRASALRAQGLAFYRLGSPAVAIDALEEARQLQRRNGNTRAVALIDDALGHLYQSVGNSEAAREVFEEVLRYWREAGNVVAQTNLLNNLGVISHALGSFEEAGLLLEEAIALAKSGGIDQNGIALATTGIGDLYTDLDAFDAARIAYREAAEIAQQIDYKFLERYLVLAQARIARRQSVFQEARRFLARARSGADTGTWELEMGRLLLAQGPAEAALPHLQNAVDVYEKQNRATEAATAYLALAAAHHTAGQLQTAVEAVDRALQLMVSGYPPRFVADAREQREFLIEVISESPALSGLEQLLAAIDDYEEKLPSLRRVLRRKMATVPFGPPRIRIHLLGEPQVSIGGQVVARSDWQTPMAPALLYLVLAHPEGLTKEEIGTFLWPEYSPGRLKVNFQKTIYRLRRALVQDVVIYDEETQQYRFNRDLDYTHDVELFRMHLLEARTASGPVERAGAYRSALELYRGPYLDGEDELWIWPEREALAEAYREAALELAELDLQEEAFTRVLALCRRLLAEDPCLEEAHRLAMRAHAGRGNMAAVVRQFNRCQQALEEEIRVYPSQRTIELYHSLTATA
jgi:LuxR family transcriptional regulator, maltose regulon positive regulatory protein